MPFGLKPDPTGRPPIDFNKVYESAIKPAIQDAGLVPIRADQEQTGGIIHKPMFERLLLCEYAVADLTTANANVFYELGVRHTARPRTTQTIFAKHQPIPFDVNYLRGMGYSLGENNAFGEAEAKALRAALTARLNDLRQVNVQQAAVDSPIFQLLPGWPVSDLTHLKTDEFQEQVACMEQQKTAIAAARAKRGAAGAAALREVQRGFGQLDSCDPSTLVDLMLSYRSVEAWTDMVAVYEVMPAELKRQILPREQYAFALNRQAGAEKDNPERKRALREQALKVLEEVEDQQGANPETCGLIGRIYKDLWDESRAADAATARGYLKAAVDAYTRGFEADLRDAYPGINAVTLLDIRGDKSSKAQRDRLIPVVRFAAEQRLRGRKPDYWDYATMLELAVLGSDEEAAQEQLDAALAAARGSWEPDTTSRNLKLIREARSARGEDTGWLEEIITALDAKVASLRTTK